ncbi:hypothetical protein SAMN05421812_102442 [Asanoa hainanensis]|uniref:Uncharacterized protein n=1 Tax=Asanoa hainanensis TaxID=560556 RepID=A0A239IKL8_9ACTN|nr:hypothetical protein [Asanoa hainanensis]SNS94089.1 hypothetical protein SAMN05421812_102442 [Asanoa hainanensis]
MADQSTDSPAVVATRSRSLRWIGLVTAVVVIGGVVAAALVWQANRGALTEGNAQRECRSALERDAESRGEMMSDAASFTVDGIELEQTRKTAVGYSIDATVNYTLALAGPEKFPSSLRFTCEVLRTEDGLTASLTDR